MRLTELRQTELRSTCCAFVKVKEVNYMFPQGSTQWKVLECLLIKVSHLEQRIHQTIKGKTAKARAGSERAAQRVSGELNLEREEPASAQTHGSILSKENELC